MAEKLLEQLWSVGFKGLEGNMTYTPPSTLKVQIGAGSGHHSWPGPLSSHYPWDALGHRKKATI